MTIERVAGSGDLLPVDRELILTFDQDVAAAEVYGDDRRRALDGHLPVRRALASRFGAATI